MVTQREAIAARREAVAGSPDLQELLATVRRRSAPLLERAPVIPDAKALLSIDGGVCPDDHATLRFDPWSPDRHTCPRCGKTSTGERHDRWWARFQHLWVAERAADLAAIAALTGDAAAAGRAREILQSYGTRYFSYPNRDNVLGPSRLFFSTYLESLFVCSYLAAAATLRASDALDEPTERAVGQLADEAANLIGEFDERFSNRQTWNNAALTAIAVWFEDAELAQRAIAGQTGLTGHVVYGFRTDGLWYEGENYHLFALRGLLTGIHWARAIGLDFTGDPRLTERVGRALLAPALTALPDLTFPARKDSRFGVSLAQPMYLEAWEIGLALLKGTGMWDEGCGRIASWLHTLYGGAGSGTTPELFESYLHDAPYPHPTSPHPTTPRRASLSWWPLLEMLPELPAAEPWRATSVLFEEQGFAVLRREDRYASLEAGLWGGGHGHPDRLNLTLHAGGTHWLPDPGTGSYVSRDLFWYRSTLAHNAPQLDGRAQTPGNAACDTFDEQQDWAWARGRFGDVQRTIVAGPRYLVDVVELTAAGVRTLELPWHFTGEVELASGGSWSAAPGELASEFVSDVERLVPAGTGPVQLRAQSDAARLTAHLLVPELLRASGPGLPGSGQRQQFYVARARGRALRLVTVLEPGGGFVREVRHEADVIEVRTTDGVETHRIGAAAWSVDAPSWSGTLRGARDPVPDVAPILELEPPERARGTAFRLEPPPPLDGTAAGFDAAEPLLLDLEDQYRRSEEAYAGPDDFAGQALVGWDDDALYVCVDVVKQDLVFRPPDAPPLGLDNETDDIHSDGLQVYLGQPEDQGERASGVLLVPEPGGGLRVSPREAVRGSWRETETGYCVTFAFPWPAWLQPHVGDSIRFDLIINEMLPDRQRRAGQLAWSGGNGWVWLRGDRQEWARLGALELVG